MNQFFSITTTRAALAEAVKLLASGKHKVVESRNTIPVVSCLRLAVDPADVASFTVEGTDFDLAVSVTVNAFATTPGAICIDAGNLHKVLAKMKGETVTITDAGGGMATIRDDDNGLTTRARTEKPADFPIFKARDWSNTFEIGASDLLSDFENVGIAISTEEARYYLNGIFMHADESSLKFAATDGHRLVRSVRALPDGAESLPDGILPRKAVGFMARALKSKLAANVDSVAWQFCGTAFTAKIGRIMVKSKLIDGTFPDYSRVIPAVGARYMENRIAFDDAAALADGIESVTAHASDRVRGVVLSFGREFATLYCNDAETGKAGMTLTGFDGEPYSGNPFAIAANGGYLRECLSVFGNSKVNMGFSDGQAPFMIESPDMTHLTVVQMPYRIDVREPITPEALAKMNGTPLDLFTESLPGHVAALDAIKAGDLPDDTRRDVAGKVWRKLGQEASEARAWLASNGGDAIGARLTIKRMIAEATGDMVTRARVVAWQDWLAVPESERPRGRIPGPVPGYCVPCETALPVQAGDNAESLPVQAGDKSAGAAEAVAVVNVLITGNRRVYVLARDWEGTGDRLARVYDDGTPFCDPESKGGAWQTIARADVLRTIAPRGPYKEAKAGADNSELMAIIRGLQERVTALESENGHTGTKTPEIAASALEIGPDVAIFGERPDISEIRGHETSKRALEIAAVGGLSVSLSGPAGIGKSMLTEAFGAIADMDVTEGRHGAPGKHITLELSGVSPADMTLPPPAEATATVAARVATARARLADIMPDFATANDARRMIVAEGLRDELASRLMIQASEAMRLTPAQVAKVWATALCIACLSYRDEPLRVGRVAVAEALSYTRFVRVKERTESERRAILRAWDMRRELRTARAIAAHASASQRLDRMPVASPARVSVRYQAVG